MQLRGFALKAFCRFTAKGYPNLFNRGSLARAQRMVVGAKGQ